MTETYTTHVLKRQGGRQEVCRGAAPRDTWRDETSLERKKERNYTDLGGHNILGTPAHCKDRDLDDTRTTETIATSRQAGNMAIIKPYI